MNIVVTRAAEGLLYRSFTVAEICRMVEAGILAEDENFELIEGELVPISAKGNQHEVIKAALSRVFARQTSDDLRLAVKTSLYLDERTFVEPDLCLYPKRILPEDVKRRDVLLAVEVAESSMPTIAASRHGSMPGMASSSSGWSMPRRAPPGCTRSRMATGNGAASRRSWPKHRLSPAALPGIAMRMADLD